MNKSSTRRGPRAAVRRSSNTAAWAKLFHRGSVALIRANLRNGSKVIERGLHAVQARHEAPAGPGEWIAGVALGPAGIRRYHLFRPAGVGLSKRAPLLVMLHGCGQDANSFARSTRMNQLATRHRFLVLYPEQDRRANLQGCWNWYDTDLRRAYGEAATVKAAIDQVCQFYAIDRSRMAVAGLSAGASMAALLATRYPDSFKAVVMHSGIAPGIAHSPISAILAMRGRGTPTAPHATAAWPHLLVIHGSLDAVVASSNGATAAQLWAEAAHARTGPSRLVRRGRRYPMTVTDFRHRGRKVATLCEVVGLGHAWSGGADSEPFGDGHGPDASRMAWTFIQRQFRAGA